MGKYLTNTYFPKFQIFMHQHNQEDMFLADNFHQAAVNVLSKPFINNNNLQKLGKNEIAQDPAVSTTSIRMNSSIWVIGPYIAYLHMLKTRPSTIYVLQLLIVPHQTEPTSPI